MPLFEFECTACGAQGEFLLRNDEIPACTACGSSKMKKLLSHFAPMSGTASSQMPACGGCDMSTQCGMSGGCCGS